MNIRNMSVEQKFKGQVDRTKNSAMQLSQTPGVLLKN